MLLIIASLLFHIVKPFTSLTTGFFQTYPVSPVMFIFFSQASLLILIKPVLFIFPLIFVQDCKFSKSLKLLKYCKLSSSKELIILYFLLIASNLLWVLCPTTVHSLTMFQYVLVIVISSTKYFLGYLIMTTAVRHVGSLNLYPNE